MKTHESGPRTRVSHVVFAFSCLLLAPLACSKRSASQAAATKAEPAAVASVSALPPPASEPQARHRLELSAYAGTLAADDDAVYVLARHGAYRLGAAGALEHWSIELGDTPALGSRRIVYWLDGKLRHAPKHGGPGEVLASVARAPRRLCASGERLVWDEPEGTTSQLRTLDGSEPRTIHRGEGTIEALALVDDQAYFVERAQQGWRLGAVALGGGPVRFTEPRAARAPAQLVAAGDVFFYDGPSSSVRRISSDLLREDVVARDVICSPLAVADRAYCAQIDLLFDLPRDGGKPRLLAPKRSGTIVTLVATASRVAWLLDVGEDRSELEVLSR